MGNAGFAISSHRVGDGLELTGLHQYDDRVLHCEDRIVAVLRPPETRAWGTHGNLAHAAPVRWGFETSDAGVRLRADDPTAVVDLLETRGKVADAFRDAHARSLAEWTVVGSFTPVSDPLSLQRFLIGGEVFDTNLFAGHRCRSEQTALSLYRLALLRQNAFWDAVATHIASWARERILDASGGLPVHGNFGEGETHMRFLVDAALLLLAEEERGGQIGRPAITRVLDAIESLGVPSHGGRWYLHDTLERDRETVDLVLNTHVHALVALHEGGRDIVPGLRALDQVLALPPPRPGRAFRLAAAQFVSDVGRSTPARRVRGRADRLARRVHAAGARDRARSDHLRLPGGWLSRDVTTGYLPHYVIVNLNDLAVLHRIRPTATATRALRRGLRFARASRFFQAQVKAKDPLTVLIPPLLLNAGHQQHAARSATWLTENAVPPTHGWPGLVDNLWSSLPAGTP